MLLGIHCSISGGFENALALAKEWNIDTLQIFTKNQRQWKDKVITDEEGEPFRKQMKKQKIPVAFAHCTYLINLASTDEEIREKSVMALASEMLRCDALGLSYAVLHPGANRELSEKDAIKLIGKGLKTVIDHTKHIKAKILLENTAGMGSSIGWKFEHIRDIMKIVNSKRVGMCLDTCHAFAAGYDIRTMTGFEDTIEKLDETVGLDNLFAIHVNDSKGELGSRIDRHDHIGQGKIGLDAFKGVMKHFKHLPKVLETDHENDLHLRDLEVMRSLA
jgi:deoxyribonuclease-4